VNITADELKAALPPALYAKVQAQLGIPAKPKRQKYGNQPVYVDGIRFPSRLEANFYAGLKVAQDAKAIRWFCRQARFAIEGGEWVSDFIVVMLDGTVRVIDCKGFKTKGYRHQKRQIRQRYSIEIEEVQA